MLSQENRCYYRKSPLDNVICQLRFPEILKINAQLPVAFQEAIREQFPQYTALKQAPAPRISGAPGNMKLENRPATTNYQFSSADGVWQVNLTSTFISLTCNRYQSWEEFAKWLDKPLAAFIKLYKPAYFDRVGLRYLNFISRQALSLEDMPFSSLMAPCWIGPLAEDDVPETSTTRCSVDVELSLRGGCRAKIHAGPGLVKHGNQSDPEIKFIFDQDLYMSGNLPVNLSAGALQTLHSQSFAIFRGAISDILHEAMEPVSI